MKHPNEHTALGSLGERIEAEFGAVWSLNANCPMLDVRLGSAHIVVDYDNGPDWQPPNLYRVAELTDDYAFNVSSDPAFSILELAEAHLRTLLAAHDPKT